MRAALRRAAGRRAGELVDRARELGGLRPRISRAEFEFWRERGTTNAALAVGLEQKVIEQQVKQRVLLDALALVADSGGLNGCERTVDSSDLVCRRPGSGRRRGRGTYEESWCMPCVASDAMQQIVIPHVAVVDRPQLRILPP